MCGCSGFTDDGSEVSKSLRIGRYSNVTDADVQHGIEQVGQTGNFLTNLSQIFGVAFNQAQNPPAATPPPPPEPTGLTPGMWLGIIGGTVAVITIIVLVRKANKNKNGK